MSKKEKPVQSPKYNYKAVYAGRVLSSDFRKVYHCFIRTDNKEKMHFQGVVGCYIGHTYECGASNIPKRPVITTDPRVDNPEWEATDALVDHHNAKKRAEAKMRALTKPSLKAAVEALRPLMRGLSPYERRALIEFLADQARQNK